jgi:hypothetical protein
MKAGHVIEIERAGTQPQVVVVVLPVQTGGGDCGPVYEVRDEPEPAPRGVLMHALRANSQLAWWVSFACGVLIALQLLGD